jgi:hypothetical protein
LGSVRIKNSFWITSEILDANKNEGSILPGSARTFEAVWGASSLTKEESFWGNVKKEFRDFHFGFYVAQLDISWGTQGQKADAHYLFFVLPWHLLLVVIPLALIVVFLGKKGLRLYNQKIINQALQQKE